MTFLMKDTGVKEWSHKFLTTKAHFKAKRSSFTLQRVICVAESKKLS